MPRARGRILAYLPFGTEAARESGPIRESDGEAPEVAREPGPVRASHGEAPELTEILGSRVQLALDLPAFLDALKRERWAATLLGLDGEAVDLRLARRVTEAEGSGVLFLAARDAGVEAILAAEATGAATLLPFPLVREMVEREILPLLDEPGAVEVPAPEDGGEPDPDRVVGTSPSMISVYRTVARIAASPATVLISGESGTGKELVARALHRASPRRSGPFVPVNCAALPDSLLEAELFGYERGAFTGAVGRSLGRFGRADGGTLFLDEVGEMSLSLQAKLLRVLETGEVERLGADRSVKVEARVVGATNRDLGLEVETGRFREDLFYRITVVELTLPPLRDRPEDILPLTFYFVNRFSRRHDRPIGALSREAVEALHRYSWPGNVRELRNVLDRAVLLARGGVVRRGDLRLGREAPRTSPVEEAPEPPGYPPTWSLDEVEGAHIRAVLVHTRGHMGEAAEILGIHRNTMTSKVRDHGIDVDAKRESGTDPATGGG